MAGERLVPICYFDFLAECVSSYQVRNCECEDVMSVLGAPVSRLGCHVSTEPMLARGVSSCAVSVVGGSVVA